MFENVLCVTFDLDDTLWPIEPTITKAEAKLYEWLQENYPEIASRYSSEGIAEKRKELPIRYPDIAHNVTALRWQSLMELADEFGLSRQFADQGLALFRAYRNEVIPFPKVEETLIKLKSHFKIGAITNGNAQLHKIAIGEHFEFVVTAEDVGSSKPCKNVFKQAAREAGMQANQIVHVGDSAQTDILGASNAGYKTIWMNAQRQSWPGGQNPHAVIHCISELQELLIK